MAGMKDNAHVGQSRGFRGFETALFRALPGPGWEACPRKTEGSPGVAVFVLDMTVKSG